ncbi:MAG: PEGA domain-containing protein, partial [Myxococcota bacterium]|nr:PEGA domain-containing protein [Myxococcota bacterium]
ARATSAIGATTPIEVVLPAEPVSLQVLAPTEPRLTLDGEPITAGAQLAIPPGSHVVRLEMEGMPPIERRFEVLPGAAPMVIDLAPTASGMARRSEATLLVASDRPARVMVDGLLVGGGAQVEAPVRAGEHEIRVEAEGHAPFTTRRSFALGDRAELHVDLAELGGGGLAAPRIVFGVITGVAALGMLGTTIAAVGALEDYDQCTAQAMPDAVCGPLADESEAWATAAVASWALVGALAITTIVLLIADDSSSAESSGSFVLAPVPIEGGVVIAAGGRL